MKSWDHQGNKGRHQPYIKVTSVMNDIQLNYGEFPQGKKGILLLEEGHGEGSLREMFIQAAEQWAISLCQGDTSMSRQENYLSSRFRTDCRKYSLKLRTYKHTSENCNMKVIRRNGSCRRKRRNWALATEKPCNHRKLHVLIVTKSGGCNQTSPPVAAVYFFYLAAWIATGKTCNQYQHAAVSVYVCACMCKCWFIEKSIFKKLSKK